MEVEEEFLSKSDLFVEMLDENGATRILEFLGETIPGFRVKTAPLKQKKIRLKQIFRNNNRTKRREKSGGDRFFRTIQMINSTIKWTDDVTSLSDKELLFYLSTKESVPDFVKWAYILYERPNSFEELQELFSQKLKEENDRETLFNFHKKFESENEAISVALSFIKQEPLDTIIEIIRSSFTETQKNNFSHLDEQLNDIPYHVFLGEREKYNKDFGQLFVNAVYGIKNGLLETSLRFHMMLPFLKKQLETLLRENTKDSIDDQSLKQLQEKMDNLQKKYEVEEQKNKRQEKKIQTLTQSLEEAQLIQTELENKYKKELEALKTLHKNEMDQFKLTAENQRKHINDFFDRIDSWAGEREEITEFAIIYSRKTELLTSLYPEIRTFFVESWEKHRDELLKSPVVYIQRDGCNSNDLKKIERAVRSAKKSCHVFFAPDEKSLIEAIEAIKTRVGINHVRI